jgi:hypothetical protein
VLLLFLKPGLRVPVIADLAPVLPSAGESLLHRVLGLRETPHHREHLTDHAPERRVVELIELEFPSHPYPSNTSAATNPRHTTRLEADTVSGAVTLVTRGHGNRLSVCEEFFEDADGSRC